ncbi:MAG: hypothetical protein JXD23_14840 [Spirochaetales bacterium]|nr:hypothetical protein [Spirochaetales bacterium]
MKFKIIFIIFNIVIISSFLFIFLSPLFVMGPAGFLYLLQQNYVIAVVFFVFLAGFNLFFFKNWRYYSYLENEDWNSLITYLEDSIYRRRSTRVGFIRTLLNAYVVTSNMAGISRLEKHFSERKPSVVERFSLQFGIPYLLGNQPQAGEAFFASLLNQPGTHHREWMRWNLAFSLLQQNKIEPAKRELVALLDHSGDFVLTLLVLYLLEPYSQKDRETGEKVSRALVAYRGKITKPRWEALFEDAKKNIEVLMLTQIIGDASKWFFQEA